MRSRFYITILLLFGLSLPGWPQMTSSPGPFSGFKSTGDQPVEITASRMEADLNTGNLRFSGNVTAKQGARTIYAEAMDVVYTQAGEVVSIEARGNVKVTMKDAFAVADRLVLDNQKRQIRLLGSPRVVQGKQIITGESMLYEMETDKISVKQPRIEWRTEPAPKPKKASSGDGGAPAPGTEAKP